MKTSNWFYLISFKSDGLDYLMITNDKDNEQQDINYLEYTFEDQIQWDGPKHWITYIQNIIEEELDSYATLDFDHIFCCYKDHYDEIVKLLYVVILEYNLYWNE